MSSLRIQIEPGDKPCIIFQDSDCSGRPARTLLQGTRIFKIAPKDHKRYWKEMIGTYMRNKLNLCPDLPPDTVFRIKFPRRYELYGGRRESGAMDYYLIGFHEDDTTEKFDSPANFVMHGVWLANGRVGSCGCKPCSGTPQLEISNRLTLRGARIHQPRDEDDE